MQQLKKILSVIVEIFDIKQQRKEIAEAYLANSSDLADLEARQRYLSKIGYL